MHENEPWVMSLKKKLKEVYTNLVSGKHHVCLSGKYKQMHTHNSHTQRKESNTVRWTHVTAPQAGPVRSAFGLVFAFRMEKKNHTYPLYRGKQNQGELEKWETNFCSQHSKFIARFLSPPFENMCNSHTTGFKEILRKKA